MGYVTAIAMDLYVKEDLQQEFESRLKDMKAGNCDAWFDHYEDLGMYDDGELFIGEEPRKWYDDEGLYDFLKRYVKEGTITGWGEDCWDYWRVRFDGEGSWRKQVAVFVDEGSELAEEYGD